MIDEDILELDIYTLAMVVDFLNLCFEKFGGGFHIDDGFDLFVKDKDTRQRYADRLQDCFDYCESRDLDIYALSVSIHQDQFGI